MLVLASAGVAISFTTLLAIWGSISGLAIGQAASAVLVDA
jgi:hypothetical protein